MTKESLPRTRHLDLPRIPKRRRLTGAERDDLRQKIATAYIDDMATIDEISHATGRAYGTVHQLLTEAAVPLRPVGFKHTTTHRDGKTA
jgi:hypothetical protein